VILTNILRFIFHLQVPPQFARVALIGLRLTVSSRADYASISFIPMSISFISSAVRGPGFFPERRLGNVKLGTAGRKQALRFDES
jgi:hypothetical protein